MESKTNQEDSFAIKDPRDFVTHIRHNNQIHSWIIIHEANFIDIIMNSSIQSLCQHLNHQQHTRIHLETNIYDGIFVSEGKVLVSNKSMPAKDILVRSAFLALSRTKRTFSRGPLQTRNLILNYT